MPRSPWTPSTSELVRDTLMIDLDNEAAAWDVAEVVIPRIRETDWKPPTHSSVAQALYCANELGLVEIVRTESGEKNSHYEKKIYRVVKPEEDEWRNPKKALYNPQEFEASREFGPGDAKKFLEKVRRKSPLPKVGGE